VSNAAGDRDVTLTVPIPTGIVAGDWFQLYRSKVRGGATLLASDDLQLAYEVQIVAGDLTAGALTIVDTVKQDALGAYLYTSETQEGIGQANYRPPVCRDMVVFRDCGIYGNTRQPHRLIITLAKVFKTAVSDGLTNGNQLVIAGVTYTADKDEADENYATGVFWVDETSTDAAVRIRNTCMSLTRVINGNASNTTVYAYFLSNYHDEAGKILIERRDFTDTSFAVTAGTAAAGLAFLPALPTTGVTVASSSDAKTNCVITSKPYQLDAVPLQNEFPFGQSGETLIGMVAGRTAVWLFTSARNLYRMTGDDASNWSINLFDSSTLLYGPKTAVAVGDGVMAMTTRGVMMITDSGIQEVSKSVHDKITAMLSTSDYPNFERDAFAIAYDSEELYLLQHAGEFLVYCWGTGEWSIWDKAADAAAIGSDGKMYFTGVNTGASIGYVYRERKTNTRFDFADQDYAVTVVSNSAFDVVLASVTGVSVGQALWQSNTRWGIITAVDTGTATVTVDRIQSWQAGAASVYDGIDRHVKLNSLHDGTPGTLKRYRDVVAFWRYINGQYQITLSTNFDGSDTTITVNPTWADSAYGLTPWGSEPWGGRGGGSHQIPARMPVPKIRALWINLGIKCSLPFLQMQFSGWSVVREPTGTRWAGNNE
jgi:hypothetical protein